MPTVSAPSRVRGWAALFILCLYVVVPGILGMLRGDGEGAMLPKGRGPLLLVCATELGVFAVVLAAAVRLGSLGMEDLRLRWRGGWWVVPRAAAWSMVLRIGVGLVLGGCLAVWQAAGGVPMEDLEQIRPKVEAMVDVASLRDPVYLGLMLTVVSFVLAGLREELWRAGMLVLLGRALPRWFGGRAGPWLALVPIAVVFGLAHAAQGLFGVAATAVLGLGLGAVMLLQRSIWDAVLAHGFFNAMTFALLVVLADRMPELAG